MGRVRAERAGRDAQERDAGGSGWSNSGEESKNNSRVLCLGNCSDGLNGKCHRRRDLWGEEQICSGQVEFGMSTRHRSAEVE